MHEAGWRRDQTGSIGAPTGAPGRRERTGVDSSARTGDLTRRIRAILAAIPAGTVATYGQVAALAGNPRAARAVVWVLRRGDSPDTADGTTHRAGDTGSESGEPGSPHPRKTLPWHRVINSRGTISLPRGDGFELQRALLLDEGVSVTPDGRVDLARYLWDGRGATG
jgi:methylated-DNA-protein-cysteine methyltransferase-like protein